jgi:hypothetical protein
MQACSITDIVNRLFLDLNRVVTSHEYVKFLHISDSARLGEIVDVNGNNIKLRLFQLMDSMTLSSHFFTTIKYKRSPTSLSR